MPGKIYLVSLNGVPKYVGFTIRKLDRRWKQHICEAKTRKTCPALHSAINKYGPEAFTITEIYSGEDVDHTLNVMEPQFIREYKTHVDDGGYNISYGGGAPNRGIKVKEETRDKIRKAKLGKKRAKFSRKSPSKETREKIRQSQLKRFRSLSSETSVQPIQ